MSTGFMASAGAAASPEDGISIGVDIGTTYSKVSHITIGTGELNNCKFLDHWGHRRPYVPTALSYDGRGVPTSWGYELSDGQGGLRLFKYSMLHEDDWLPEAKAWSVLKDAVQARNHLGKRADEVFADYISQLWSECRPLIQKCYPMWSNLEDHIRMLVVTYPSGWPKQRFQKALEKSALLRSLPNCTVAFLTEAEAAAEGIMTEIAMASDEQVRFEHDDPIVVVDHGGLTADLIGGTIVMDGTSVAFRQVTSPSSILCGGAYLSDTFAKVMEQKVESCFEQPAILGRDFGERALRRWETNIMPSFSDLKTKPSLFPVPRAAIETLGLEARRTHWQWVQDGAIHFSSEDVASILEFGIDQVVDQITISRQQLGKEAKYVFVTGGFSGNEYFQSRVRDRVKGPMLIFPSEEIARTIVSRGAAVHGLKLLQGFSLRGSTTANYDFDCFANGKSMTLFSKGDVLMEGMRKFIRLPWAIVEPGLVGGERAVRLRLCRIMSTPQEVHIIKWQPTGHVAPRDRIILEMVFGDHGRVAEFAFWHNGVQQSRILASACR